MSRDSVAIFLPCFVTHFSAPTAARLVRLLTRIGVSCRIPSGQTCCGQPSYNAGLWDEAAAFAERFIDLFADAGQIVAPSASCVAMIHRYPQLPTLSPALRQRAKEVADRTFEVCTYLVDHMGVEDVGARFNGAIAYHDSCHALRELAIRDQPRLLLRRVQGLELLELPGEPQCCGFGGTFSIKYPELSASMADAKLDALERTGTSTLVSTDLSCLLHLEARARRRQRPFRGLHVIDVLGS